MLVGISSFWGLLKIFVLRNSRNITKPFHLWPFLFGSPNKSSSRHISRWNHLPKCQACCADKVCPNQNSHLLGSVRTKKTSLSARTQASEGWTYPRGIVGWDGLMGLIWLGYTFGRWRTLLVSLGCGLWKDLFWGGNIRSIRIGNSFKMEHWARKIINNK